MLRSPSSSLIILIFMLLASLSAGAATTLTPVLTVDKTGNGAGVINGPGINCGLDCTQAYNLNTVVTLTATPAVGSIFAGWMGCASTPTPQLCRVTMSASRSLVARFNATATGKTALSLYKSGDGLGTVVSSPTGINCTTTCPSSVAYFTTGTTVTLTATPATSSTFVKWSNCTPVTANPRQCTVALNTAKVVTATFNRPVLTVRKAGVGLVVSSPAGIFCGADCTEPYNRNTPVNLIAIPAIGFSFSGWSGCIANPSFPQQCTVSMTASKLITASFSQGGAGNVGSVALLANPPQLATAGLVPVNLTAVVRNTNNVLLKGITVTFSASNNGTIQVVRTVTDETGTATAILTSPGDKSNRNITVTASAGNPVKQGTIVVPAVGTTISSSGANSAVIGSEVEITFTLNDSAGAGIGGQTLTVTSNPVENAVNPPNPVTNAAGQATVEVTANVSGNIVASALGATGTHPLSVTTDNFVFTVPNPQATGYPPDVCLIATNCTPPRVTPPQTLTVKLTSSGIGIAGKTVTFETTRGTLSTISAVTNAAGEATTTISSDNAGPAVITAKTTDTSGLPIQTQVQVNFVATTPTQMTLQAAPSTISVNVPPSISQTSTITATVRDVNFNLVKGVTVNFTLTDVTGGAISPASQITDQFGQASTVYTASSSPSALNGVKVDAAVAGFPVIGEVTLTVAQQALFITLGTGNLIAEPTTTTFALPYSALVTDTAGLPVANAVINLNVVPVATSTGLDAYAKGYWQVTKGATPPWSQVITASCLNEDLNQNGILDPGEDFNGNGRLDPGNVATVSKTSLTTDASGFAYFDVLYAQQYAQWVRKELTARANVAGSQATETARFILPILASKLAAEGVSPPGNPSPYGFATTCANPN